MFVCLERAVAGAGAEPRAWPSVLNVQQRLALEYLDMQLPPRSPHRPPVRRLTLSSGAAPHQRKAFLDFLQSMSNRRRMGVVHLRDDGAPRRTLYLVPASASVVERLQVCAVVGLAAAVLVH